MLGLCKHAGFDKKNIDIYKDYNKLKHFDTTNLLKIMSKKEGIIIGPMPHRMKNCFNLIHDLREKPQDYPPFVEAADKEQHLKVTKNSLKIALDKLCKKMHAVDNYAVV